MSSGMLPGSHLLQATDVLKGRVLLTAWVVPMNMYPRNKPMAKPRVPNMSTFAGPTRVLGWNMVTLWGVALRPLF